MTEDNLKEMLEEYQEEKKKYSDLEYSTFLRIRKTLKNNNDAISKDPKALSYLAGHDHEQAWRSLYAHVECNEHVRDDNLKFDMQERFKVPKWVLYKALGWRYQK